MTDRDRGRTLFLRTDMGQNDKEKNEIDVNIAKKIKNVDMAPANQRSGI